jgi:hypothetical protein
MNWKNVPIWVATVVAAFSLAACGGSEAARREETPAANAAPSDIEAAVQRVVAALDDQGIDHTEPVRADVELSGAKARFEMTINGFNAGINVFPDADALATWQELSDSFGGIHVAFDNTALSLNSSEGIANSAEIAPRIAESIGGTARGA